MQDAARIRDAVRKILRSKARIDLARHTLS